MGLQIYNTLTRRKEPFEPLDGERVTMYVCGPTVYDYPHLGHAKSYVSFDIIARYLRHLGYGLLYVQNITDVGHLTDDADEGEDKIQERARQRRVEPMALVETFTREYFAAMDALNVLRPDISPRASGHIPEMLELIRRLVDAGHAYESQGNVYFDVASYPEYGKLARRRIEEQGGSRVAEAEGKRSPEDFALWKHADPQHLMRWPSPWGVGYPGWHIECSAMSMKYLGETIDLHGAGVDNLFPHNEDEVAQSEAATGRLFVRYWLHNGSLLVDGEKMSKSKGNFITVGDAIEQFGAMLLRFYVLNSHYRSVMNYSAEVMESSRNAWERLRTADENAARFLALPRGMGQEVEALQLQAEAAAQREAFQAAMDDDFNTPVALAALFELASSINRLAASNAATASEPAAAAVEAARGELRGLLGILGLELPESSNTGGELAGALIEALLDLREEARARKDFATSDRIRARLGELGVVVEDRPGGASYRIG